MASLVETDDLYKAFGPTKAVNGITLKVSKGEVLGFLGPNGAGKSTTMKMITGFLEPDSGEVRIGGLNIADAPRQAKSRIGYLPEGAPLYGEMTTRGFLQFIAEIRGASGAKRRQWVDAAIDKAGLDPVVDRRIDALSKGFKRRVGLAQAILHDPDVLILDEPTDGLDPNQKHHVRGLIADMAKRKAIIISTHLLEEVEAVCSRAVIIDQGRIVADGTADELHRRAPTYNAVMVKVASGKAAAARKALGALKGVVKVETAERVDGRTRLRVLPEKSGVIAGDVAAVLKKKAIVADEIFVEPGNLEDVFRNVTMSEAETTHA